MASDQSLSVTFWTIFHSLMRAKGGGESEIQRATRVCGWLTGELGIVTRSCSGDEAEILGLVYQHWADHKVPPTYDMLKHVVVAATNPKWDVALAEYESVRPDLKRFPVDDLPALLSQKSDEFRQERMSNLLKRCAVINTTGVKVKVKAAMGEPNEVTLKGPDDALNFLISRIDAATGNPKTLTHGVLQECGHIISEAMERNHDPEAKSSKLIKTGIQAIDTEVEFRQSHLVGILGYGGAGKSRLLRTWIYNAAQAGHNCMHFSFEQTFEEELTRYAIMHSCNPKWGKKGAISLAKFENGCLTRDDRAFLDDVVIPDMELLPGKIVISQPQGGSTWEATKTQISMEDRRVPLDMVGIDYLSMVRVPSGNKREAMEEVIEDAKRFAMEFRDSDGLLVASPVQGSRDGWRDAGKHEGRWNMDGVFMYSMFDKALDTCLWVYDDDNLKAESRIMAGTCKHRRGRGLPPSKLMIDHACGQFMDNQNHHGSTERDVEDFLEEL